MGWADACGTHFRAACGPGGHGAACLCGSTEPWDGSHRTACKHCCREHHSSDLCMTGSGGQSMADRRILPLRRLHSGSESTPCAGVTTVQRLQAQTRVSAVFAMGALRSARVNNAGVCPLGIWHVQCSEFEGCSRGRRRAHQRRGPRRWAGRARTLLLQGLQPCPRPGAWRRCPWCRGRLRRRPRWPRSTMPLTRTRVRAGPLAPFCVFRCLSELVMRCWRRH